MPTILFTPTKRFATFVGRRCRQAAIKDVAKELKLDWHTVKELDKQYMRAQLARAGTPAPKVIGIDEIAIRKGHTYRIVVSDLERRRPIWFGGSDRSEASMALFYDWLGPKKGQGIRLTVMDMWKPFRTATAARAPKAAILFDKFHVMRHLGEALDAVRKSEYARLEGSQRRYIKGQKYTLLSRRENLSAAEWSQALLRDADGPIITHTTPRRGQILSLTMFQRMPINSMLSRNPIPEPDATLDNQLKLFD